MDKLSHPLAVTLRALAILWLVAWALFATFGQETSDFYLQSTLFDMAVLLLPAALAVGVSLWVDRMPMPRQRSRKLIQ